MIATYYEKRFSGKRHFELFHDKIKIHGKKYLQNDFEYTIDLKDLKVEHQIIKNRDGTFWGGILCAFFAFIAMNILSSAFSITFENSVMGMLLVVLISGVLLCIVTFKKIEFYQFQNHNGVVLFDIGRSGKEKHNFDNFVSKLVENIKEIKNGTEPLR